MVKVILSTVLDFFSCGPCGKWKTQLQNDDADLWNDLTFAYAVPDEKPPAIPKVVKVVSDSDTDEDVSTLYESFHHGQLHWRDEGDEEKSSSPSLTTPKESFNREIKQTTSDDCSPMYGHDLELEQVLEEINLSQDDDQSLDLDSIMGPRSLALSVTSRNSRRTSSSLPVIFSPIIPFPPPSTRPISLLQQQQEILDPTSSREEEDEVQDFLLPLSARPLSLIKQERDQYHSTNSKGEDEKEHSSLLPVSARPPSLLERQREQYHLMSREDCKEEDCRDEIYEDDDYDHDDGSSYSSVCRKTSFFKKKRIAFRSSSNNDKKTSKMAISNNGWQILHGESTDTSSTVQTQNHRFHNHIRSTLQPH